MKPITTTSRRTGRLAAAIIVMVSLSFAGSLWGYYPPNGAKPDGSGGWMNPSDGMCVIGVDNAGTMRVDWSITEARDCVAWTRSADGSVDLTSMDTSDKCTKTATVGNDGYKHAWSTSICYDVANSRAISRVDLDNTDAMCISKGGTVVTTGKCVALGWVYRNRKAADNSLPITGSGISLTDGVQATDNLGFCYASMRMTGGSPAYTASTCPSYHNSQATAPLGEWPSCLSSTTGCQTQASYDAGLGWSWDATNSRCVYSFGIAGPLNAAATNAAGTVTAAGTTVDLTGISNQGDCLAAGYSWDNWLPRANTTIKTNADLGDYGGMPAGAQIRKLDALTPVEGGGGEFFSGTGFNCLRCHSDQSRAYQERNKPGFVKTRHQKAGDDPSKPFQPYFTAATSDWGLQGVQCAMCHSTAKPARDDLIQVVPAGVVGPPASGAPKSATGHNQTEYGAHLLDVCFHCHGTPATPPTTNPASVIPVSSGDWTLTAKGLAPIANQFLNSPHAEYAGSSAKVDIGDKTKYGSTFEGYTCRTAQGKLSATTYPNAGACTGAGLGYAWYITTSNGSFCYHTPGSCAALPGATWTTTYSAPAYPWAADTGGPGGVCTGVGIGSIITTVYRNGVAQKIHNVDSTANPMCTNPGDGSATSGAAGFWIRDGETSPGTPNLTDQGNCMTCHDVHWALADTNPEAEPFRRECTSCHVNAGASASGAPQIDPMRINHLSSAGTPLEHILTEPDEACETCHMPKSGGAGSSPMHLWRINTDATYTTMGAGQANLAADGTYTNAAWVDLDHACGQCHYTTGVVRTSTLPRPTWPVFTRGQLAIAARGIHGPTAGSNVPPVADGTCAWNADTWTMTLTDASTDDHNAIVRETVNWGDGSVVADDTTAPFGPFSHTYIGTGSYPITHKVIDDAGQQSIHSCSAAPTYFAISGTVTNNYTGHTGPLAGVTVSITKVSTGVVAATVVTDAAGAYSVATLKPGAYSVFAVKVGYVFPPPTVATVGPNQVVDINSPTPILRSVKPIPIKKSLPGQINVPGAN